jgi:transcription initiation factor TFIID TATA-box-binding protein
MIIKIVNIIASGKIDGNFDIEALSLELGNVQYEPEQFSGLIYRKKDYTIICFYSGKISSHGTKTETASKKAIIETINEFYSMGRIIGSKEINNIKIENMVASGIINLKFDIADLSEILKDNIYEPEQFPGLLYRPFHNSIVCLIFSSSKIVIVGAKNKKSIIEAYKDVEQKIKSLRSNGENIEC